MNHSDTKQRILDAAERLFALHGFHATSLRAITQEAGANLAAVNYHFGCKDALLDEVLDRRLGPLNQIRTSRIDQVEKDAAAANRPPEVQALWRAFVEPTLNLRRNESGSGHFLALIGQALAQPRGEVMEVFMRQMAPMFLRLFELTCCALPDLPRQLLFWRVHFAVGSLSHLMRCNDQSPVMAPGVTTEVDVDSLTDMLLDYTLAGLEAPR